MPSRLVTAGSAEPAVVTSQAVEPVVEPMLAPVREVTVRGLVVVGDDEEPSGSGLARSSPIGLVEIDCALANGVDDSFPAIRRCASWLRLVHDESIQSPARPGWTVRCTEHDQVSPVDLTVSVVIPTYNEARNLPSVLLQIPREDTEVVVVDGRSSDGTLAVVHELCPDAVVVEQPGKGKGDALRAGFEVAKGDVVVMLDADGSMSPREIPAFVGALLAGADLAKGSRHLDDGGSSDLTPVREAGNQVLGWLFNRIHGTRHTDLCYGYMAFWRSSLPAIMPYCDGFEVETLLNVRAAQAGLRVVEVPSHEGRRGHGESNLHPIRDGLRVLRTLWRELPRSLRLRSAASPVTR
jgi:hypothetical protein